MYHVTVKGIDRSFPKAKDAIAYYQELIGRKVSITWHTIRALNKIINGDIELYYAK